MEQTIVRLIGAVLLEANDEWQMQHRYMGVEAMGEMLSPASTKEPVIFMLGRIDAMLGRVRRQAGSRWQCEALS